MELEKLSHQFEEELNYNEQSAIVTGHRLSTIAMNIDGILMFLEEMISNYII